MVALKCFGKKGWWFISKRRGKQIMPEYFSFENWVRV
jgi:hypothetical protein